MPQVLLFSALVFIFFGSLHARGSDPARLDLDRIYNSDEFRKRDYSARWQSEGSTYLRLEAPAAPDDNPGGTGRDLISYEAGTGKRKIVVPANLFVPHGETSALSVESYSFSKSGSKLLIYTNSKRVWRRNTRGDYWVLDISSRELRQIGKSLPASSLMFAKFSPDGTRVAYVHKRDIYVEDLGSASVTQITKKPSETIINGTFDWVYEEELGLRDGFRWSPDGESIAFWQLDTEGVREFTMIDNTSGLYPSFVRFKYPKVGEVNSSSRIGVVPASGGKTVWLDVPGDPRNRYLARMDWSGPGEIVLQQLNRLQNRNRVFLANSRTGIVTQIHEDNDDAWVEVVDDFHWIDDGARFTWLSERDGWNQIYLVSRTGGVEKVTTGSFDVISFLHVDEESRWIYFLASPDEPTRRYLYRARFDGRKIERVTPDGQPGSHSYSISPDGAFAVHTYSTFDDPPRVQMIRLPSHEKVRALEDNRELRKKLERLDRDPTEFFRIEISEGVELDAWCIHPPGYDSSKKYPLLIYVYGEPAGTTVVDRWGGNRYLWHLMLAQRGYFVMSIDNRGTPAPMGRAWRKMVYRRVGVQAPEEQAAALRKVLELRKYLDPDRVGVWGWSGGGSMTLNAMFKFPGLYAVGMSVAPVANQRGYDTIYQERYMGLPSDNVEGFRQGSPINFAGQLEGDLLIVHGTGDDNCHYANTEALIDELIRHNKVFTMMAYPNRTHSIREGTNTTRHLRALLTRFLETHLSSGPR